VLPERAKKSIRCHVAELRDLAIAGNELAKIQCLFNPCVRVTLRLSIAIMPVLHLDHESAFIALFVNGSVIT
jgi:hypothetical protein